MKETEILKTVCEIVSEHLEMPIEEVENHLDTPFLDYPDNESGEPYCYPLDYTELIMAMEEEFGIEIDPYIEEEGKLKAINDIVRFVALHEIDSFGKDE